MIYDINYIIRNIKELIKTFSCFFKSSKIENHLTIRPQMIEKFQKNRFYGSFFDLNLSRDLGIKI